MIYDTLKMAQELEGPFSREQATALTKALAGGTSEIVATKTDLRALEATLVVKIADSKAEMIKWIVGAIAFNLFGTAGLILTLSKYTH